MTIRGPIIQRTYPPDTVVRSWEWKANPANIPPPVIGHNQYDWPNPTQPYRIEQTWIWTWLPEHAKPFNQTDWPLPTQPSRIDQTWIQTTFLGGVPFNQTDWPNPVQPTRLDQTWINEVIRLPAPVFPFNQYDWPTPKEGREYRSYHYQSFPSNIPPPVMGHNQYDWPLPTQPSRLDQTWINEGYIFTVPLPFNQYDWPLPTQPPRIDPTWIGPKTQLVVNLFPHNQYDWELPTQPFRIDENYIYFILPLELPTPPPAQPAIGGKQHSQWLRDYERLIKEQQTQRIDVKEAAAVLSRHGGLARAKALTPKQRSAIATLAAQTRWKR